MKNEVTPDDDDGSPASCGSLPDSDDGIPVRDGECSASGDGVQAPSDSTLAPVHGNPAVAVDYPFS